MDAAALDAAPTVYFTIAETGTSSDQGYYIISYSWYHLRDYGINLSFYSRPGHDNDVEGVILVVKKTPYLPYGAVVAAISQAHGAMIPFTNPNQSFVPFGNAATVDVTGGDVLQWPDIRYNENRSVVAIRAGTHGSYLAQDCTLFNGAGMVPGINGNTFSFCNHSGTTLMLYAPMLEEALVPSAGLPQPVRLPQDQNWGTWLYRLQNLADSPFWRRRLDNGVALAGTQRLLSSGNYAYDFLAALDPNEREANPPFAWLAGIGESFNGCHWYSFDIDNRASCMPARGYPSAGYGAFIAAGREEIGKRFIGFPELSEPYRYNPFSTRTIDYNAPQPPQLSASLAGPNNVGTVDPATWSATVSGGYPPYSYYWSGVMSGYASSVTGVPAQSGYLYLDVWDADGKYAGASIWVTVNPCSRQYRC